MADFAIRYLSVVGYATGFTFWHYKTGNIAPQCVDEPGFFNAAANMASSGDMIMVSGDGKGGLIRVVLETHPNVVTDSLL